MGFTDKELLEFKPGIFSSRRTKFPLNVIEKSVQGFAGVLKEQKKTFYVKGELYETLGPKFMASVVLDGLGGDYGLFHDLFLEPHGLQFVSDKFIGVYESFSKYKKPITPLDRAVVEYYDIIKKSKQFAQSLHKKGVSTYLKKDIYNEFGKSFVKCVFMNDFELFNEVFLEQYDLQFISLPRNKDNNALRFFMDKFFKYLRKKGEFNRNPVTLRTFSSSFYTSVIHNQYNHDWDRFFSDIGLNPKDIGFFIKNPRILTEEIIQDKINIFIEYFKRSESSFFSPIIISDFNRMLYENLIRLYRIPDGRVDWLFILVRFFKSEEFYSKFRHRINAEVCGNVQRVQSFEDYEYQLIADSSLDPEEKLIADEDNEARNHQYEVFNDAISNLDDEDKIIIERFLNGEDIGEDFFRLVRVIQDKIV